MTTVGVAALVLVCLALHVHVQGGRYAWMGIDNFNLLDAQVRSVNQGNCHGKSLNQMTFRKDTVTQIPKFNQLRSKTWYKNRTSLIHLHNMALTRAFYFSYILQKMNDSALFHIQPNWMYHYFSVAADINANPYGINGSALYFDTNCTYPNWYQTVNFNNTLPLYAPKAWRWDDYGDQDNFLREPTRRVAQVADIGAGHDMNYTHPGFAMNPWYRKWLPDVTGDMDSLTKFTYYVGIKYSNETGRFTTDEFVATTFFGPSSPSQQEQDERMLPVVFTEPYFDCGRSNKWVVSATSPIVDYMPRYSNWTHLRRQRFVGVIVMDIDFPRIDFNPCPTSTGNPGPSFLSGIARCKPTTQCKFKAGRGFSRGGYECWCRPGYRSPVYVEPPFQGKDLEQATDQEYDSGFACTPVDNRIVLPKVDNLEGVVIEGGSNTLEGGGTVESKLVSSFRSRSVKLLNDSRETIPNEQPADRAPFPAMTRKPIKSKREPRVTPGTLQAQETVKMQRRRKLRGKRSAEHDLRAFNRMMRIFQQKDAVRADNCGRLPPSSLVLPGDVAYGVEEQFQSEGRTALRLAHFLSSFLQNTDPNENFGNLRGGGRLHPEHVFGEVIANVMGNHRILSSGVFFDSDQFVHADGTTRELFGPLAYRRGGSFYAIDAAGLPHKYTLEDWYSAIKLRWVTNLHGLLTYKVRMHVRSDPKGESQGRFEHFPVEYRAPAYEDGAWSDPHFRCDGRVDSWVITYVVPFFAPDLLHHKLEFKGVVTVDVPLALLQIHQCPQSFHVANAFKNTARCHQQSTKCRPLEGFPFMRGNYRCDCRLGYEYAHLDGKFWIEGSLLELEYEKKVRGFFNRFDLLRCRIAAGRAPTHSLVLVLFSLLLTATLCHRHCFA